jgi:hypothetical protein
MLKNVSVSIPYLVLSTEVNISGEITRNILTPFGYVAIGVSEHGAQHAGLPGLEIRVLGDTDTWLVDCTMPPEFKSALARFITHIAQEETGTQGSGSGENSFVLVNEQTEVKLIVQDKPAR